MEVVSRTRCFGGTQLVCRHDSRSTGTPMRFGVFLPPDAERGPAPPGSSGLPVLWFLSGLTCTEANFTEKAGAQRLAAELGLLLVVPDTSPRGEGVADDPAYDLGQGAGFYLDATEAPWAPHFRMESWITDELPELIAAEFPADMGRQGISGHSMGGHGALTLSLRHPGRFRSTSAFSPIVSPLNCPWGEKALGAYLGPDRQSWRGHDACALIADGARVPELLVDQGTADPFLDGQLKPGLLRDACDAAGIPLTLRMQEGYDHSYFFIASFVPDHLRWHAERLRA
ncbi:S-formylglutathione hydrolase [Roseomonas sp. BN140053]|uniref:S-formylglutathione hydrolase n=1 Tax=Roseomonas sp. BN140053 TaxID=3391898 RepID=UPI0039E8EF3D